MFAVIYRGFVNRGCEKQYILNWTKVANYFVQSRGALGSTLHKTEDGMWVAYSKWPSKEVRDNSWPQENQPINSEIPQEICEAILIMKDCLDKEKQLPEICMNVVETIIAN